MCKNRSINGICSVILCRNFLVSMDVDNRKETKFRPESSSCYRLEISSERNVGLQMFCEHGVVACLV